MWHSVNNYGQSGLNGIFNLFAVAGIVFLLWLLN